MNVSLAKKCFTLLLVAGLCLAFLPQAQARPHLPRKAAKGVKAVGGKIVHGAGRVLRRVGHPFSCN